MNLKSIIACIFLASLGISCAKDPAIEHSEKFQCILVLRLVEVNNQNKYLIEEIIKGSVGPDDVEFLHGMAKPGRAHRALVFMSPAPNFNCAIYDITDAKSIVLHVDGKKLETSIQALRDRYKPRE